MRHPDVPMARPFLGVEEEAAAARVLRSGWIMQGPEVAAFEREFADFVGAPHACAVSSGTAALHLGLLAIGVRPGDEVITVSHSFVATANSIRYCGASPVFVDIEPDTYNIDVRLIERALTPKTRAILCVHQLGQPCDLRAIVDLARARGLGVVEDAACAAGSEIAWHGHDDRWERIGRPHGDVACFSFHPRKLITTGDGGMVTTRDATLDGKLRAWRSHTAAAGIVGFNYRLTDVQAAIGRVQLGRLPGLVTEREALVAQLRERLTSVRFPSLPAWARTNWQSLCVRLPSASAATALLARLADAGIAARPGLVNAHELPEQSDGVRDPLVESERAARECVLLPLPSGMTAHEIDRVVAAVG